MLIYYPQSIIACIELIDYDKISININKSSLFLHRLAKNQYEKYIYRVVILLNFFY